MRASDNGLESSLVGVCARARTKHLDRYRIALSELGKLHVVDRRARKRGLGGSPWDRPRASLSLQQDSPVRRDDGRCFRDYVIPEAQTNDRWLRNFWKCAEEETVRFGSVSVWKFHRRDDDDQAGKILRRVLLSKDKILKRNDFNDRLDSRILEICIEGLKNLVDILVW